MDIQPIIYPKSLLITNKYSGPGGIRTRDLFSAIDKKAGENGKKAVFYV
jgi:hypothetical protein